MADQSDHNDKENVVDNAAQVEKSIIISQPDNNIYEKMFSLQQLNFNNFTDKICAQLSTFVNKVTQDPKLLETIVSEKGEGVDAGAAIATCSKTSTSGKRLDSGKRKKSTRILPTKKPRTEMTDSEPEDHIPVDLLI